MNVNVNVNVNTPEKSPTARFLLTISMVVIKGAMSWEILTFLWIKTALKSKFSTFVMQEILLSYKPQCFIRFSATEKSRIGTCENLE